MILMISSITSGICPVVKVLVIAEPAPPENIKIENASSTSITICWKKSVSVVKEYLVTYHSNGQNRQEKTTEINRVVIENLKPGNTYTFHIASVLTNGKRGSAATVYADTGECDQIKNK